MYKRMFFMLTALFALLVDYGVATCQTYNTVRTFTARKPIATLADIISDSRTTTEVLRVTGYVDGFGRPVQTVSKQASPLNKDAVEMHVYDSIGREVQQYLPFVSNVAQTGDVTNDGNFKTDALQQQSAFNTGQYPGETYYYAKTDYESSPLNRTLKVYAPGSNWVGASRGTSSQYLVNTTTDNVRIWNIAAAAGSLPTSTAAYGAGKLYKVITTDEKGVQSIQYQDKDGNLVLKKVQLTASADPGTGSTHAGWLCTYYVYDDYNNLRFVITPKVVQAIDGTWTISQTQADELCIRTEYDLQNRAIIKKMPGAGEQWYVYDERSRLVMSQDANQRAAHKWQYYQYDNLDRQTTTGLMTDPTNYNNRAYHQTNAATSTAYPNLASYTKELLSQIYYDNYSWTTGTGLGSSLDQSNTSNTTYFYTPSNTTAPYPQAITQTVSARGMATGSKTEVLGSGGSQYLYTESFYDDKGRGIQTQATNITGGVDKSTLQYSWRGNALRTLYQQANNANGQSHKVSTKITYDHEGRMLTTRETIYSTIGGNAVNSPEKMIDSCTYNELGQLKTKSLGYAPSTSTPLETQAFDYNIQGWMTGINKAFTVASSTSGYFGMEMGYDKSATTTGTTTFTPIYNGNMSGEIWKSKGDKIPRKYSFSYDNAGRLTAAAYLQNSSGSTWDKSTLDFSVNSLSYDYNGNLASLNQKGYTPAGSKTIDSLTYDYMNTDTSNRLLNVIDKANNAQSKLGDFHYTGTKTSTSTDYTYDVNGNQVSDVNKAIASITYNVLNLPQVITVTSKGTITYTYDAAGNKLKKVTQQNGATIPYNGTNYTTNITTTTTYIGGFVYQSRSYSNGSLAALQYSDSLYILHPEGRARLTTLSTGKGYAFDYFVRDNLGNVRVVLTDEQEQDTYPAATLEDGGIATEQKFYDINPGHVIATSGLSWYASVTGHSYQNNNGIPSPPDPTINRTATSAKIYKLTGGSSGDRYGLGIALKVMAGDQVSIFGKSVWHSTTTTSNTYPLSGALNAFLSSFAGTGAVLVASHGQATGPVLDGNPTVTAPLTSLLGNEPPVSGQTPKAYISWIIFDDQFRAVSMGSDPVNATADVVKSHTMTGISVPKNGFIYIYCSNESNQDVYFDNLQVVHTRGPLIQEQHYYPQGLTMTGISSAAFGKLQANYGYQGKEMQAAEFSDTTGLEEYDFAARYYDPQLGRWWVQDPDEGNFPNMSPYAAMMDNPATYTDPDGKCPTCLAVVIGALVGAGINVATHWHQIMAGGHFHWDKFGEAALIGGGAGAVAVLTGGASFAAAGGAAAGAGGFLAGAAAGATSSAYAGEIEGIGNAIAFGDQFSSEQYLEGIGFGALTGGLFNGVSALAHDRGFLKGNLLPKSDQLPFLNGHVEFQDPSVGGNSQMTNDKLVSEAATRAENNVPSIGNPAVDGTFKHQYATEFIDRYQNLYGNRGLETNVYFNNQDLGIKGFLDVKDVGSKIIYDFKFGNPVMRTAQALKYSLAHPGYIIKIVSREGIQYIRIIVPK